MVKIIKARYRNGQFEPLESIEELGIEENTELTIGVAYPSVPTESEQGKNISPLDPSKATEGAWKDSIDDSFEEDLYRDRLLQVQARPEVER